MEKLMKIILGRIHRWGEAREALDAGEFDYLFQKPELDKEKILWKKQSEEGAASSVGKVLSIMEKEKDLEKIKNKIMELAEREGKEETLWPLRYSLSGQEKSPDPFTLIDILGVEESKERVKEAIRILTN